MCVCVCCLQSWTTCKKFYLVDLWQHQANYTDWSNVDDSKQNQLFEETKQRLAPWADKTEFIRNYTTVCGLLILRTAVALCRHVQCMHQDATPTITGSSDRSQLYQCMHLRRWRPR